jgi:hypothetical protein
MAVTYDADADDDEASGEESEDEADEGVRKIAEQIARAIWGRLKPNQSPPVTVCGGAFPFEVSVRA